MFGEGGNSSISWDDDTIERTRTKLWVAYFLEASWMWWEHNWSDDYTGSPANLYIGPTLRPVLAAFQDFWEEDIDGNLTTSEANWPGIEADPASEMAIPKFTPAAPDA